MANSHIALIAYAVVFATVHADHGTQIDLFCTPQLMDADVPQPLRTADIA